MEHIELLNEDAGYLETHTMSNCSCNTVEDGLGGNNGCGCDTYVCTGDVDVHCGVDIDCDSCNIASDDCYMFN